MRSGASAATASRPAAVRSVAGCETARPALRANALTGLGMSWRPRPCGRSGWVSTPTMVCRDVSNACSAGTANCGVPAKATRSGLTTLIVKPCALARAGSARRATTLLRCNTFLAVLVQLLADPVALHIGEVIDEQLALEMVHFMLYA